MDKQLRFDAMIRPQRSVLRLVVLALFAVALLFAGQTVAAAPTAVDVNYDVTEQCKAYDKDSEEYTACVEGQCAGETCITKYTDVIIKILSAIIGIVVTVSIIAAGIMYSSARGDPNKVTAAKKRIYNSIFALLAYIFLLAFLEWVIPGGIRP